MRVLIVDDSARIRERLAALLAEVAGVELQVAEDADEGLAIARRWAPGLVLLDVHLPRHSGLALLPELKALRPAPLVVVLTGHPTEQHRRFCLATGADYFFDKASDFVRVVQELAAGGTPKAELRTTGEGGRVRRITLETRGEGVHGVVRDVTERAELEEELAQLRRAESIGYLTASLAHDFNNLLTVITCSSAVLATEVQDRGQLLDLAHEIQLASERATAMVRQLLSRLRRPPSPPRAA